MGTRYSAKFYGAEGLDADGIGAALFAAVSAVDQQMSTWKADSDLSRLNAAPTGIWVPVPPESATVLAAALEIGRESRGAFDIGVGDLVNAWGFGPRGQQPDALAISGLLKHPRVPANHALEVDESGGRVRKHAPVCLDLSGIAKGFGVDQLARCLDDYGLTGYLVGIDGEMRARGLKADGQPWAVAIERPLRGVREVMGVLALSDTAVATSGDYRHWVEVGTEKLSHTMHPARRGPLTNRLAAVTVVAPTCMLADAWATVLMVQGEEAGPEWARARGLNALFVLREGHAHREVLVGPLFENGLTL